MHGFSQTTPDPARLERSGIVVLIGIVLLPPVPGRRTAVDMEVFNLIAVVPVNGPRRNFTSLAGFDIAL